MSRRSEPVTLPRIVDGVPRFGSDPWAACGWCGARWTPGQSDACPQCVADAVEAEGRWRSTLQRAALETLPAGPAIH